MTIQYFAFFVSYLLFLSLGALFINSIDYRPIVIESKTLLDSGFHAVDS